MNFRHYTKHYPKTVTALSVSGIIFLILLLAEVVLRLLGSVPGVINRGSDFVTDPKDLQLNSTYTVDSFGIMSYSNQSRDAVNRLLLEKPTLFGASRPDYNLDRLVESWRFQHKSGSPFLHWRDSILKIAPAGNDEYLQALSDYFNHPLNHDGFRSIAFRPFQTSRKKLLLLGDSFTFGFDADPLTESFPDQLLMSGYVVYNSGISSVDPEQYLAVVKKHLTVLKPDAVVINFYWGNDLMPFARKSKPFQYALYPVGKYMVNAAPYGEYLPLADANEVTRLNNIIPNQNVKWINRFLAKTVLGTKLWLFTSKLSGGEVVFPYEMIQKYARSSSQEEMKNNTSAVVSEIVNLCLQNGVRPLLVVIPDFCGSNPANTQVSYDAVFKSVKYIVPPVTEQWFTCSENSHFNNFGHKAYAAFLMEQLDSISNH